MSLPVAFLFPGQGSQAVGMGSGLWARFPIARDVFAAADDVLGFALSRLCFEGPLDELTLTENAQPALVTCSWALTRVLEQEFGLRPSWVAGHSLGEFSALVAAGALRFEDAVRVVRERGRAMQSAVAPGAGTMAALLGLDLDQVRLVCSDAAHGEVLSAANLNGGGQIVIAGSSAAVERAMVLARERGARRALPLNVSAPFHCALMQPAADRLATVLAEIDLAPLACPVISNVEASAYDDVARTKDLLVRQVTHPVRWEESVQALAASGCTLAIEVGPGKVLAGLVKRIAPSLRCLAGEDPEALRAEFGS
jgi:[acyl-carrier-protein] S-malonyltransferase